MKFPRTDLRQNTTQAVRVPVVNPNGTVKRIRISNTITSPILLPQFAENDKTGELVLVGATIRAGYKEDGWELLEDMYRSEGEEGLARWSDYLKHWAYEDQCIARGQTPEGFPSSLLPEEALRRQRGEGRLAQKWAPAPRAATSTKRSAA